MKIRSDFVSNSSSSSFVIAAVNEFVEDDRIVFNFCDDYLGRGSDWDGGFGKMAMSIKCDDIVTDIESLNKYLIEEHGVEPDELKPDMDDEEIEFLNDQYGINYYEEALDYLRSGYKICFVRLNRREHTMMYFVALMLKKEFKCYESEDISICKYEYVEDYGHNVKYKYMNPPMVMLEEDWG